MDLPLYNRHNDIFTCVYRLTKYCRLIPCFLGEEALSTVAKLFFDSLAKLFGIPAEMISDKDPRFTVSFW